MKTDKFMPVAALFVFTVGGVAAAGSGASSLTMPVKPDTTGPAAVVEKFVQAINYMNWEDFKSCLSEHCVMVFPFQTPRANNKTEILEVFETTFERMHSSEKKPPYFEFVIQDMVVQAMADEIAVVSWNIDAGQYMARRTAVLKQEHGVWLIVNFHASNLGK